jgi:hypothetical protein
MEFIPEFVFAVVVVVLYFLYADFASPVDLVRWASAQIDLRSYWSSTHDIMMTLSI